MKTVNSPSTKCGGAAYVLAARTAHLVLAPLAFVVAYERGPRRARRTPRSGSHSQDRILPGLTSRFWIKAGSSFAGNWRRRDLVRPRSSATLAGG